MGVRRPSRIPIEFDQVQERYKLLMDLSSLPPSRPSSHHLSHAYQDALYFTVLLNLYLRSYTVDDMQTDTVHVMHVVEDCG